MKIGVIRELPAGLYDSVLIEAGVIHYCVKSIPNSVPVRSARALSNFLFHCVRKILAHGLVDVLNSDAGLFRGATVVEGRRVSDTLAREYSMDHYPLRSILTLHVEAR